MGASIGDRVQRRLGEARDAPWARSLRDTEIETVRFSGPETSCEYRPTLLRPDSVVYSFGIGRDLSLDMHLVEKYGVTVHAFDPTPDALDWVATQVDLPEAIVVHEFGLAGWDGVLQVSAAPIGDGVSRTCIDPGTDDLPPIEVPVKRLATIVGALGHEQVDFLKMDIEGAEYAALPDMVASSVMPTQILVEFHHHLSGVSRDQTTEVVQLLKSAGYGVFWTSRTGREFGFIRR